MTRPLVEVERARALHESGESVSQIARLLGVSRWTVRDWVAPTWSRANLDRPCFRCTHRLGDAAAYVYLLGLYLGDGCLSAFPRAVWRLRIFQDQRYVGLIAECKVAISAICPGRVGVQKQIGCVEINAYWQHWLHLFPQHGAGPKWLRRILLELWQQELIHMHPFQLLRGLIHSDGCRSLNRVRSPRPGRRTEYAYPRYYFTNASDDIRALFTSTCDVVGVRWTHTNARSVAVSRRADVALLDGYIGPKY